MSNVRADLDRHTDEIRESVDHAADVMTLAIVGVGIIAVAALVIAVNNGGNNGG